MRVILDESLPKPLMKHFGQHDVSTVVQKGWSGKKNGELLRLIQKEFDVFVTADKNLQYQQNLIGYCITIIVLVAPVNRYENLKPLMPKVLKAMSQLKEGKIIRIS